MRRGSRGALDVFPNPKGSAADVAIPPGLTGKAWVVGEVLDWLGPPGRGLLLGSSEIAFAQLRLQHIATASGILVARLGGEQQPLIGLLHILGNAHAVLVQHGEIVLAVGEAVLSGGIEPADGALVVALGAVRSGEYRKIVHGLDVALRGGALIPSPRTRGVGLHAEPALVKRAKTELRHRKAAGRRALVPLRGFLEILVKAFALGETRGDLELRRSIALRSRQAERERPYGRRREL